MVLTEGQKQAIEKLDAEMEAAKDPCSKYIAEQLLQLATSCPEVAEKILEQKKTLAGVLDAIKAEAKKHAVGGCGCVDEAQAVEIACKYYNIKATEPAAGATAAADELEDELNNVLERWLEKYQVEAGWYKETGKEYRYSFDGIDFIRL